MASTIGTATARDGTVLRTRHWPPPGEPWAVGLIVHGASEHSGRWEQVGNRLAAAGIDTHAYDQRGWGGSGGRRGDIVRWEDYLDDLEDRLAGVRSAAGGRGPVVLYAHSLGGLIATQYVLSGRPLPDVLVLSAPGIDSTHRRSIRAAAAIAARTKPTLRAPTIKHGSRLSRDPAIGASFAADPLAVHDPTARLGARAFAVQRATRSAVDRLAASGGPFPVLALVIHGEDDPVVQCRSSARFESFPNVTRRVYPGLRHELHNEPEGESIVRDVIDWIRGQDGARPRD
jgi:alpha-beta hydrolase superfamily lysophospholipase